jgi:cysteinyl-tRNA synthetase
VREIRLHNTHSGAVEALEPRDPGRVAIYACGPTVYSRIHVGNARPFVVFSLLKRFLEHEGLAVTLVVNVTDVNDKIYVAAREAGVPSAELAHEMARLYRVDTDDLGLGRPDHEPLASETMGAIIEEVETLIDGGSAYAAGGDVFFSVRSDPAYGELSHRRVDEMDQGEGVEGSDRKRDPLDFALWKGHKPDEDTSWASPWGRGRPGWHIECSAMAEQLLGLSSDIHGGIDLLFPHHENEAAQTRCARGVELARLWMHNGMLQTSGEKMAKSVGNIAALHEVLAEHGRDTLLMYLCSGHYRQPIAFAPESLAQAAQQVRRVREAARTLHGGPSDPELAHFRDAFFDALARDFNTPDALAAMWEWVRESNRRGGGGGRADLAEMLDVLGLANLLEVGDAAPGEHALELLERRQAARADRDYAEADRVRDELLSAGWVVRDTPAGPELVPADLA